MPELWYSYDLEQGIILHDSAEAAEAQAVADMEHYAGRAHRDGEWNPDLSLLSWGRIVPHETACLVEEGLPSDDRPDGWESWALVACSGRSGPG